MSNDHKITSSDKNYQHMVKEYARIQTAAYTSKSAKSSDIAKLREQFSSYFHHHKTDTTKRDKVLGALDGMVAMAREHEVSHGKHTSDKEWDKDRKSMDSLLKDLAPAGTSLSVLSKIPGGTGGSGGKNGHGSSSEDLSSSSTANKLEDVGDSDGSGFSGDLDNPMSTTHYKGLSLDQLVASNSTIGQAMRTNPDLVSDIRAASARTGVPAGLMAAVAYAESSFGGNAATTTNADGNATVGIYQGSQAWMDKYNPGGSLSSVKDNVNMFANAMVAQYQRLGSWGGALRAWNSSGFDAPLPNANDLSETGGAGDTHYVTNILGLIAMGHPAD